MSQNSDTPENRRIREPHGQRPDLDPGDGPIEIAGSVPIDGRARLGIASLFLGIMILLAVFTLPIRYWVLLPAVPAIIMGVIAVSLKRARVSAILGIVMSLLGIFLVFVIESFRDIH